jgi:hypothetical protein
MFNASLALNWMVIPIAFAIKIVFYCLGDWMNRPEWLDANDPPTLIPSTSTLPSQLLPDASKSSSSSRSKGKRTSSAFSSTSSDPSQPKKIPRRRPGGMLRVEHVIRESKLLIELLTQHKAFSEKSNYSVEISEKDKKRLRRIRDCDHHVNE